MTKKKIIIFCLAIIAVFAVGAYGYLNRGVTVYADELQPKKIASNSSCANTCVFIWSINCSACVYSLPHLNILQQHLAMNNGKLVFVLEEDNPVLRKMARAYFIRLNMTNTKTYYDKKHALQKRYKVNAYPTMLVFNNKGKLVKKIEGFVPWAQGEKVQEILNLLNG